MALVIGLSTAADYGAITVDEFNTDDYVLEGAGAVHKADFKDPLPFSRLSNLLGYYGPWFLTCSTVVCAGLFDLADMSRSACHDLSGRGSRASPRSCRS